MIDLRSQSGTEMVMPSSEEQAALGSWADAPVSARLRFVRVLRHLIAENAQTLASLAAATRGRSIAEKLTSEVLPLAESCRWLERYAAGVLAPRRLGRSGRPLWLFGVVAEIHRRPLGTILVIGPGNYPLFLPAVHALQALVAGNEVRLKPAPGTGQVALAFARLAIEAGLPPRLLEVLDESDDAAQQALAEGASKVVFTGSSENGRKVLARIAGTNTPAVMELSGEDPVIVLPDADVDLAGRALNFGLRLNGGGTCIAPRRLILAESVADSLLRRVAGAEDLPVYRFGSDEEAVTLANRGTYGLGASVFSQDLSRAQRVAAQLVSGFVSINDLIVPTADPRIPFGGVKGSGFGTTRGAEGLLEMTYPHVVSIRRGGTHQHFDEPAPEDAALFLAAIRAAHGRDRFRALPDLWKAIASKLKSKKQL